MLDFALSKNSIAFNPTEEITNAKQMNFRPGKVIRVFGPNAESCCATFLSEFRNTPIAWIGSEGEKTLRQVNDRNIDWKKILFVHGKEDRDWALMYLLKTGIFPVFIFQSDSCQPKFLEKILPLLLRKNAMLFLLCEQSPGKKWFEEEYFAYQANQVLSIVEAK